jgi:hypothetical protein
MSGWTAVEDHPGRWIYTDDNEDNSRHFACLSDGGQMVELHGDTVHTFRIDGRPNEEIPLTGATWTGTVVNVNWLDAGDDEMWAILQAWGTTAEQTPTQEPPVPAAEHA